MKILVSSDSTYPKFITQHCSYRRLYSIVMYRRLGGDRERKGRWWHTLKRLARALISRLLGFFELRNAQTIEPTTAWTAVSSFSRF